MKLLHENVYILGFDETGYEISFYPVHTEVWCVCRERPFEKDKYYWRRFDIYEASLNLNPNKSSACKDPIFCKWITKCCRCGTYYDGVSGINLIDCEELLIIAEALCD